MATQLFLLDTDSDIAAAPGGANLRGTASPWHTCTLGTSRGSGFVTSLATATVAGATVGVEVDHRNAPTSRLDWLSPPLAADTTISGTVTCNIWSAESNMSANVAINVQIDKIDGASGAVTSVLKTARTIEVAITTRAADNFTATPTSTNFLRGDRIRIRVFGDDAGTMGSGFTFNISYHGASAAADGDTYVTFTENFSFASEPATQTLYFTDNSSIASGSFNTREIWTARGAGALSKATDVVTGWSPIIVTNSPAGAEMAWFTRALAAMTIGGPVRCNIRGLEQTAGANATLGLVIDRCANDGTFIAAWARGFPVVELGTTETTLSYLIAGDDLAISEGERLRFTVRLNGAGPNGPMAAVNTVTYVYGGTSGGATGDSFVTFGFTLTESSGVVPDDVAQYLGGGYYP